MHREGNVALSKRVRALDFSSLRNSSAIAIRYVNKKANDLPRIG